MSPPDGPMKFQVAPSSALLYTPVGVPTYTFVPLKRSGRTHSCPKPVRLTAQLAPPSVLLYTVSPKYVVAYRAVPLEAIERTSFPSRPPFAAVQVAPLSVLLYTPSLVPAYSVDPANNRLPTNMLSMPVLL